MRRKDAKDRPVLSKMAWRAIPIALEYVKGQKRHGRRLPMHYGFFPASGTDPDGDHVDVFVDHDGLDNDVCHVINQRDRDGGFDEHKVIVGAKNCGDAKALYESCYPDGWTGCGTVVPLTARQLAWWLKNGDVRAELHETDLLPESFHKKAGFCPDFTAAEVGALVAGSRDEWQSWYANYCLGKRAVDEDKQRQCQWEDFRARIVTAFRHNPTPELGVALVKKAVDPLPLLTAEARREFAVALADRLIEVRKFAGDDRPPIVAIDLDGTLAKKEEKLDLDKIPDPRPGMQQGVKLLDALGCCCVLWTCRGDVPQLRAWLSRHAIPIRHINESPYQPDGTSAKLFADVYLDDRAEDATRGHLQQQLESIIRRLKLSGFAIPAVKVE